MGVILENLLDMIFKICQIGMVFALLRVLAQDLIQEEPRVQWI